MSRPRISTEGTKPSSQDRIEGRGGTGAGGAAGAGNASLVQKVIQAAYGAFYTGLRAALVLSAILVLLSGVATLVLLGRRGAPGQLEPAGQAGHPGQVSGQSAGP